MRLDRRQFLRAGLSLPLLATACRSLPASEARVAGRLFFVSQGKTFLIHADGGALRELAFDVPGQATWQPADFFPDGRRVLLLSMEPRRDGPGKPFEEYYTQTPTHIWAYDLDTGALEELATQERMAVFYTPALLLGSDRMLVQVVRDRVGQIFNMRLDGTDAQPFTEAGEGLPYGLSLNPAGDRVAFHLASPQGYQVYTADLAGKHRIQLAADPAHLYFGTSWSPDGQSVLYVDCDYPNDPGHDWCDVCVGRADGSGHRVLTQGQAMWFAATYGNRTQRGGGSNLPAWTEDGAVLFPRRASGAQVPWAYQVDRPDIDHFNREYQPEAAQGGTCISRLDPATGDVRDLTPLRDGVWDFRACAAPGGQYIAFCRAETGGLPALWVMDADGAHARCIARGLDDLGADHPRWLPARA